MPVPPEEDVSLPYDISNLRDHTLAVSGEIFRWVVDYGSSEVLRRVSMLPNMLWFSNIDKLPPDAHQGQGLCQNVP
jgi:hypothetical protein